MYSKLILVVANRQVIMYKKVFQVVALPYKMI
jgi:hypothetical protein